MEQTSDVGAREGWVQPPTSDVGAREGWVQPPGRDGDDPAIVLTREGAWLSCWVEAIDHEHRWVAATADGVRHIGPAYAGEASLERIGEAIRRWWTMHERGRPSSDRRAARRI